MKRHEAEKLIATIREFIDDGAAPASVPSTGRRDKPPAKVDPAAPTNGAARAVLDEQAIEDLYQLFKRRMIEDAAVDPILLHLLTVRPEIIVDVEPRSVMLDGSTLKGRVARLMAQGWFSGPRATGACRKELARTGADPGGGGTLSDILSGYVRDGFLLREGDGFQLAPGVKVSEREVSAR